MFSNQWTQTPMTKSQGETGCDAFSASVSLDASQAGTTFQWGVMADVAGAPNTWVVVTEVPDPHSSHRYRSLSLGAANPAGLLVRPRAQVRRAEIFRLQWRPDQASAFRYGRRTRRASK